MNDELDRYLNAATLLDETTITWGGGMQPLRLSTYRCRTTPPTMYVTSVRAIVFRDENILVLEEFDGRPYIVPGGRVEGRETIVETLHREILEETGWTVRVLEPIGFMHFHHLAQKPEGYEYPYPDFIWSIYLAEAIEYQADKIMQDEYVKDSKFMPVAEVKQLPLDAGQQALFNVALETR